MFKLLYPHVYGILAIDTIGRKELIGTGGIVDKSLSLGGGGHVTFMGKCFKEVNIFSNVLSWLLSWSSNLYDLSEKKLGAEVKL